MIKFTIMKRILFISILFCFLGCEEKTNVLLLDEDYASLVDPYAKTTMCDIDSESKLMSFVKRQYSDVILSEKKMEWIKFTQNITSTHILTKDF